MRKIVLPYDGAGFMSRRRFVTGLAAGSAAMALGLNPLKGMAEADPLRGRMGPQELRGNRFDLSYRATQVNFTGQQAIATAINGSVPAPVLRWREGEEVTVKVSNNMAVDTSIHWHGLIVPEKMDGVPGISFGGIRPGDSFTYRFPLLQSGTYWYHSHSGFQEQTGAYGAIIIDPKEPEPFTYERDYVVMLSDWSDEDPHDVYAKLKKLSHYYNTRERTVADLRREIGAKGWGGMMGDRAMWNQMRMSDRDISDVTGYTYTFLMNGVTPADGWLGLFKRGERVRLRFINAAAMSFFDVRIPGLKMTVVATDGQYVEPVSVDEFRIGVAETYDVIVEPSDDRAYTIFAQAMDRSGYARGTLTPDPALTAEVPTMDPAPILTHTDMGMAHDMAGMDHSMHNGGGNMGGMDHSMPGGGNMGGMDHSMHNGGGNMGGMDHSMPGGGNMGGMDHSMHNGGGNMGGMDHSMHNGGGNMGGMDHSMHNAGGNMNSMDHPTPGGAMAGMTMAAQPAMGTGRAGYGSARPVTHASSESGPHVDMVATNPRYRLDDPGVGLRNNGRRVLTYADLRNLYHTPDMREPSREIDLHLTGNMSRYMWSMNGVKFADAEPLQLQYGERVRINLINDTMMYHPIHLHGMWSDLETGDAMRIPRKHTISVQPGSRISYLVTADAKGSWAYHCHLLYHMMGMFRKVMVS